MQEQSRKERVIETDLLSRIESSNLPLDSIGIDSLNLSTRSYNALRRNGIDSIDKLIQLTRADLAKIRNIGITSIQEILTSTNQYLQRIAKPEETERYLKISLLELLTARKAKIDSPTLTSLAGQRTSKLLL